jgi:hypothetical protein
MKDKNSRDISQDFWNFSRLFNNFCYLFHDFSQNPNGVLRNTGWDTLVSSWRFFNDKLDAASLSTGYVVADGEVSEKMLGSGETYIGRTLLGDLLFIVLRYISLFYT